MNNSNFNNSSSRQQNLDTDREKTYRTSYNAMSGFGNGTVKRTHDKISDIPDTDRFNMIQDNLSEKTLKTILDFHSDRAQT